MSSGIVTVGLRPNWPFIYAAQRNNRNARHLDNLWPTLHLQHWIFFGKMSGLREECTRLLRLRTLEVVAKKTTPPRSSIMMQHRSLCHLFWLQCTTKFTLSITDCPVQKPAFQIAYEWKSWQIIICLCSYLLTNGYICSVSLFDC